MNSLPQQFSFLLGDDLQQFGKSVVHLQAQRTLVRSYLEHEHVLSRLIDDPSCLVGNLRIGVRALQFEKLNLPVDRQLACVL